MYTRFHNLEQNFGRNFARTFRMGKQQYFAPNNKADFRKYILIRKLLKK
jgi:hypothetical protein